MKEKLESAKDILRKYNQQHLLQQYENLNKEKQEYLLNQILNMDFEQINKLFESTKQEIKLGQEIIEPIKYVEKEKLTEEEKKKYFQIGANEIKNGKLAVVTMAGRTGNKASDILDQKEHIY